MEPDTLTAARRAAELANELQHRPTLPPAERRLAARLARLDLAAWDQALIDGVDGIAAGRPPQCPVFILDRPTRTTWRLHCDYDPALASAVRSLPGRPRFDRDAQAWIIPARHEATDAIAALLEAHPQVRVTDRARRWLPAVDIGTLDHDGRAFQLRITPSKPLLDAVHAIRGRTWRPDTKTWRIADSPDAAHALSDLVAQHAVALTDPASVRLAALTVPLTDTHERLLAALRRAEAAQQREGLAGGIPVRDLARHVYDHPASTASEHRRRLHSLGQLLATLRSRGLVTYTGGCGPDDPRRWQTTTAGRHERHEADRARA